jgi:hypothetical protein
MGSYPFCFGFDPPLPMDGLEKAIGFGYRFYRWSFNYLGIKYTPLD